MQQKLTIYLLVLILLLVFTGTGSTKSLYLNTQLKKIRAFAISPDGSTLTFQTEGTANTYAGVGIALDGENEDPILFLTFEGQGYVDIMNAKTMTYLEQVTAPGASDLAGIVYDHDNNRVYCVDRGQNKLYVYDWNYTAKTLTAVTGSPFTISAALPYDVKLDQVNNKLYVSNNSTTINVYQLNADGAAFSIADAGTITLPKNAISLGFDEGLQYLYFGGGSTGGGTPLDNTLNQYVLSSGTTNSFTLTGDGVVGLDVDQGNHHVYISTNGGDNLYLFDQNLTQTDMLSSGSTNPTGLVVPREEVSYNPLDLNKENDTGGECRGEGQQITYTISYENTTGGTVNNVTIVDELPPELDFDSATGGGIYAAWPHTVTWNLGTLNDDDSGSLTLVVTVNDQQPGSGKLVNSCTIDSDETPPTTVTDEIFWLAGAPEIDVQRPASTSIADGGTDNVGNQTIGTVSLDYTVENSGTTNLTVNSPTGSNLTNVSNFSVTAAPGSPVAPGNTTTFTIEFDVDGAGDFSFDMDIANNDGDENPYDIEISGTVPDSDGDGIPDSDEENCANPPCDRDGDGILDKDDYDPSGWIYLEINGYIIPGGTIQVTGPGAVNIIEDGSNGYYEWTVQVAGVYTMVYTPPAGYALSTNCSAQTGPYDPDPNTDPNVIGDGSRDGTTNYMTDWDCQNNPYYFSFDMEAGDPVVINNNIPLQQQPTGISLSSFEAIVSSDGIVASWTTETEANCAGFNIHRSQQENGEYIKINSSMITAQGNSTTGASYSYTDTPDQGGSYYYKLESIDLQGESTFHDPIFVSVTSVDIKKYTVPDKYTLSQNYPNPFNPETTIEFGLPKAGFVGISIYDISGKLVRKLTAEERPAGNHWIKWDARDENGNRVSAGVYLYYIKAGDFSQTKKMLLMK